MSDDFTDRSKASVRLWGLSFGYLIGLSLLVGIVGCGNSIQIEGTQQLLASDAIDKSVAKIDFSALTGERVFFDPQYIKTVKGIGFVNADYIISALRQQLVADGCQMVDDVKEAEYIVEARVGALGGNQHDVIYGVPENNALSSMASVVPNAPAIPTIPELSVARRSHLSAKAKVAVFAYEKKTGESVWQSGTSLGDSDAQHTWLFGAGPFQKGSIYQGTKLAGEKLRWPWQERPEANQTELSSFHGSHVYRNLMLEKLEAETAIANTKESPAESEEVRQASHEVPAESDSGSAEKTAPASKPDESPGSSEDESPGKATLLEIPTD